MEHIITRRRGFRKLLAFLLCMASILGLLPAQAFAMSVGQTASSWLGDQYVGSDGNHYRAPAPYTYLAYHADGTIDVHTSSGGNAYRHYMLTDSDGISHQVYCVESGIPYHTSENTYVSESGTNSQYLNLLPAEARRGITLTAIYGWKPGAALPVSGINEDDYKMATQIILWEYQQQLTFYVSDEGWLMLPEPLAAGDYELYEVAAPYGYVLSDQPVPFTIDGSEAVVTVTQYNMPQKGQLTITKTGEVFASVQENDGLYQPVYEVAGLPGAVYDVIADEDIYTGDGTLRAEKDTVVETLTTGEDGTAKSGLL